MSSWLTEGPLRRVELIRQFPDLRCTASDFESAAWLLWPAQHTPAKTRAMLEFLAEVHRPEPT